MSVLSQSLLTLVRRHLVPLMLLSVWHNFRCLLLLLLCVLYNFGLQSYNYFPKGERFYAILLKKS